jgi:hypothetical protein
MSVDPARKRWSTSGYHFAVLQRFYSRDLAPFDPFGGHQTEIRRLSHPVVLKVNDLLTVFQSFIARICERMLKAPAKAQNCVVFNISPAGPCWHYS